MAAPYNAKGLMKNALVGLLTIASIMTAADMAGNYVLEGVREMGSELMLKPDGTFEYMLAYGALDRLAQGTWKVDGDSVVLNSEATDAVPLRLVRSAKVAANQTRVLVRAPNGRP